MCACHTDRYCIDGRWRDDDIDTVVRTLLHLPELQLLLRLIATIELKLYAASWIMALGHVTSPA